MWWKVGKWALYPIFFVFVLLVTVSWTFPSSALKPFLKSQIEAALFSQNANVASPGSVDIAEASLWRLTGVDLRGVEIREASRSGEKSATWNIDRLQMRLGIWAMIFGGTRVAFNSDLYGASASGVFNFTGAKQLSDFWIAADDLDLSKLTVLSTKFAGFRLRGIASLAMDFDSGANPVQDASGSLTLTIDGFGTASPKTTKQSKLEAEFDIVKGLAKSKKVKITGGDIEADLNLAVKLDKDVMRSRADGSGWFKLADTFYSKNAPIVDLALPNYKSLKQADGKSYLRVSGTLGSPLAILVSKESLEQKASNNPLRNMRPRR